VGAGKRDAAGSKGGEILGGLRSYRGAPASLASVVRWDTPFYFTVNSCSGILASDVRTQTKYPNSRLGRPPFGKKPQSVLYGQETRTPHPMRISLIIVRCLGSFDMFEIILGAILGTLTSLIIAHVYYRRSTRDLEHEVDALRKELVNLKAMSQELQEAADSILESTEVTKKHVVVGTLDDPEYPYK